MNTNFLDLTNKIVRRLNEVEITESRFNSVVGIHAAIKEAVLDTIREINHTKYKWPFYAVEQTQILDDGTSEYAWPVNFDSVDWNSFQIQKSDVFNIRNKNLRLIEREEWYRIAKDRDNDTGPNGRGVPSWVFSAHGNGFGVTPVPNEKYTIKYRYFKTPVLPLQWDDEIPIPPQYDNVIVSGALKHMYSFLDNTERATFWDAQFKQGIKDMVITLLGNNYHHAYAGVIASVDRRSAGFWFG